MSFSSYTRAEIVWIDDTFGKEDAFPENYDFWHEMFAVPEKIYRLLDIKLIMIATHDEAKEYIENIENNFTTYYFFIVDLTLPKDYAGLKAKKFNSSRGKNLGTLLLKKNFDFAFLSSAGSVGEVRQKDKDLLFVDFYMKDKHTALKLPAPLKNKLLLKLQSNVHWINIIDKLFDNISLHSNIISNNTEAFKLFPYIDKYKDFVNMIEFNSISLEKIMFLKSQPSNCIEFEKQCSLLILSDLILASSENTLEIQFFNLDASDGKNNIKIKMNEFDSLLQDKINHDVVWIVKLRNLDKNTFDKTTARMLGKKVIFIINDDEYENFLEMYEMPYTLLEIPSFRSNEIEQKQNLFKHLLNIKITEITSQINSFSIYTNHPELAVDIDTYIALTDPSIEEDEMSDSYEIASIIFSLFANADKNVENCIKNNSVISLDSLLKFPIGNGKVNSIQFSEDIIKKIRTNSLFFWLKNSWNFPYGVPINDYRQIKNKEEWELHSVQILENLLKNIGTNNDPIIMNLQKIFTNQHILSILYNKSDKNKVCQFRDITTSLKWPHTLFPMPSILHKKFEEINKHLWFQHNNFNFIEYSNDLSDSFNQIEMNLDFYDKTLSFLKETYRNLPEKAHPFIEMIIDDISSKNLSVDNADFSKNFIQYSNIMLRIAQIFMELIMHEGKNKEDIDYFSSNSGKDDLASLGTKLQDIRKTVLANHIYKFKSDNIDIYSDETIENLKDDFNYLFRANSSNFYSLYKDIINKLDSNDKVSDFMNLLLNDSKMRKPDNKYIINNSKDSVKNYKNAIYSSVLSNKFLQSSYAANRLNKFNLPFKLIKYVDTLVHFNFLADTRNKAMTHSLINIDIDFLYESFIFSYESMYLQYEYIIKAIDKEYISDVSTNYIEFSNEIQQIKIENSLYNSKEVFDMKLNELLSIKER